MLRQPNDNTTLVEFFRQLMSGARILDGFEVDFFSQATVAAQTVAHGLGRPYRGVIVVGGDHALSVAFADTLSDSSKVVTFTQSAAASVRRRFWVY
jgi:hypothetical protein